MHAVNWNCSCSVLARKIVYSVLFTGGHVVVGLIHANHGGEIIEYLLSQLREATSDVVRHGGCLGLGLAAMGSARADVYDQLKHCLEFDDAVTGMSHRLVLLGICATNSSLSVCLVASRYNCRHFF